LYLWNSEYGFVSPHFEQRFIPLAHPFDINIDIDMALRRRQARDEFVTMPA
jgi:hypothetical protein